MEKLIGFKLLKNFDIYKAELREYINWSKKKRKNT